MNPVRADGLGATADADDGHELLWNGILPYHTTPLVTQVAVEQSIDPGEDRAFVQVRLPLSGDLGCEPGLGIPDLVGGGKVCRFGCGRIPLQHHDGRQEQPLMPEPGPPGVGGIL